MHSVINDIHSCQMSRFGRDSPGIWATVLFGPKQHLCPGMFLIFTYLELRVAKMLWWSTWDPVGVPELSILKRSTESHLCYSLLSMFIMFHLLNWSNQKTMGGTSWHSPHALHMSRLSDCQTWQLWTYVYTLEVAQLVMQHQLWYPLIPYYWEDRFEDVL